MSDKPETPFHACHDLGWANGWIEDPPPIKWCKHLGHELKRGRISDNHSVEWCPFCGISFHIDES